MNKLPGSWSWGLMLGVLICTACFNVVLIQRTHSMADEIVYNKVSKPGIGSKLPPISAVSIDGHQSKIDYPAGVTTVLYIFSPDCPWCARNLENLKAVKSKRSGEFRFIGLSLKAAGLGEYLTKAQLPLEVYHDASSETRIAYKLSYTPETWVIGEGGRVLQRWAGAWSRRTQEEVEKYFGLVLPGLTTLPPGMAAH